jgi:single-strand DNA-binding protein
MSDNFCQIVGTVTRDPELRFTTGGAAVCSFGIAWNPRRKNANGEWEAGDPSYFSCTAWRELGENIAASITKGTRVIVTGQVSTRKYEAKDGTERTSVEINVEECSPSLRWATAEVAKTERSGGRTGGNGGNRAPEPLYGDEEPF